MSLQTHPTLDIAGTGAEPGTGRSTPRSASAQSAHSDPFGTLLAALASERPIGYSANLALICGDAKAGLLLSQLLYWTRVGVDVERNGGWIYKSREQWTTETGLSRTQQESARATLEQAGLIEQARQGTPARLGFRVKLASVSQALSRHLQSQPVQWSLFDVRSNADQVKALLGKSLAFYKAYSEVTGSVSMAVLLCKALATQRALQGGKHSDWFTFTLAAWSEQTGLTPAQLRNGKQKLCQSGLMEQAQMSYPRKRNFVRIKLSILTERLMQSKLDKASQGHAAKGLLGLFTRNNNKVDQASDKLSDCITVIRSDILSGKSVDCASGALETPVSSSSSNFDNQDGRFSHIDLASNAPKTPYDLLKPAIKSAGFSKSDGRFSHDQRQVLACLHARAQSLTTNKTTPPPATTTCESTTADAPHGADRFGGGGGLSFKDLIWPSGVDHSSIERMVADHPAARQMALDRLQLILDELASAIDRGMVRNWATYLGSLFAKELAGSLMLSAAYDWQAKRKAAAVAQPAPALATAAPARSAPVLRARTVPAPSAMPVDTRAQQLWAQCLEQLGHHIAQNQLQVWLRPLKVALQGNTLFLCAGRFKVDHIKATYLGVIQDVLTQLNANQSTSLTCQLVTALPSSSAPKTNSNGA